MEKNSKTQLFKVLELADPLKVGSDLKINGWFVGELEAGGKRLFYKDAAGVDWIFYPGDTCRLGNQEEKEQDVQLSDWTRFNTSLLPGQRVEITAEIYHELLDCLPPHVWNRETSYFEVGEPHHHEAGKAIHRACWIEFGKFFTGYPTMANRYELPGFKRNAEDYERTFQDGIDLVRFLVTFTDGSQRPYIMSRHERNAVRTCKNYEFVKLIGGEGYQVKKGGAL